MIKLQNFSGRFVSYNNGDKISKRFRRIDDTIKVDELVVAINFNDKSKEYEGLVYYGMIFLPPLFKEEIGNFTINKKLHTHPVPNDYTKIPNGPQVTWFTVYTKFRGKGIAARVYEGLIARFGALYSDYQQTEGGTNVWIKLAKRNNVNIYMVDWCKKTFQIKRLRKYTHKNQNDAKDLWFNDTDARLLLATPKKVLLEEFDDVQQA